MTKNTAVRPTEPKRTNAPGSANVTRSVVFQKNVLKLGVKRAKAEGRSFSNYLNQLLRAALLPPGLATETLPLNDVDANANANANAEAGK